VEQAAALDPSLLLVFIGNNDALGAAMSSDLGDLTGMGAFTRAYDDLIAAVGSHTRAQVVVGTIPSVDAIPQMISVGGHVGPVPFTVDADHAPDEMATRAIERALLSPETPTGECHGARLADGACDPRTGAKISISSIYSPKHKTGRVLGQTGPIRFFRALDGDASIKLYAEEVLDTQQLSGIRSAIVGFDDHIRATASAHQFGVMDLYAVFEKRSTDLENPGKLNGLFTGTPRLVPLDFEAYNRGLGNTLLGWDGVHPNSAGYSLEANEAARAINQRLEAGDFGGLAKGDGIALVQRETITYLLKERYLRLHRSRFFGGDQLLSTVE
jgi:hypothetical protein